MSLDFTDETYHPSGDGRFIGDTQMLMQAFKSAEELDITERQRDALILVLGMLEREELVHVWPPKIFEGVRFNMGVWNGSFRCGTICCIGGAAEIFGNCEKFNDGNVPAELDRLFYPPETTKHYYSVSTEDAAVALRSYLTTGHADWSHIE